MLPKNVTCPNNTHIGNHSYNCTDGGLGMTANEYNLLYAIYAWTNAVVVVGAGFLIDKVGNKVGLFLFSGLCLLGSSLFALGAHFAGTSALLPIMLVGRLLFGSGNGSLTIVQNRITAYWFRNKELAFAFGITLTFSRLGSVLNFFLTSNFEHKYGLSWTLWGGAMLCGVGFISALILSFLDIVGVKQLGQEAEVSAQSKKLRVRDIKYFSLQFWLLALSIMFFYNGVFPFVADASKFISNKYDFDDNISSYIAGSVYDVSLVLSAFLGLGIFQTLNFTAVFHDLCVQLCACKYIISKERLLTRWKYVMIFLLANTIACVVTTGFLNIIDKKRGGVLNMSRKEKEAASHTQNINVKSPVENGDDAEPKETDRLLPPKEEGSIN
ncbi:lysosomal dipeptide transporter MFSD1-like [Saccoglossus kowalevskii]